MADNGYVDESDDVIISIPQTSPRSFWRARSPLIFVAFGAYWLYALLANRRTTFAERLVAAMGVGAFFLIALMALFLRFKLAGKPALAIRRSGIELMGVRIPWDDVMSVSWTPRESDTLAVQTPRRRYWVNVSGQYHAQVEETLCRFGKWKD